MREDTNAAAAIEKEKRRDVVSKWPENKNEKTSEEDDEIRRLVEERRNTAKGEKHKLKEFKTCIRERKRTIRQEKVQQILEEFRDILRISCVESGRKRSLIPKVKNDKGETITSRKGIANVFGEFCSKLCAETQLGDEQQESQNMETRTSNEKESSSEDVCKLNLLDESGIEPHYICFLRRLFAELKGSVSTD